MESKSKTMKQEYKERHEDYNNYRFTYRQLVEEVKQKFTMSRKTSCYSAFYKDKELMKRSNRTMEGCLNAKFVLTDKSSQKLINGRLLMFSRGKL